MGIKVFRRWRWVIAAGILGALGAVSPAPQEPSKLAPAEIEDRLAAVRELYQQSRYLEAERLVRGLLADLESQTQPDDVAMARALDELVETLRRAGRFREPETRAAAERAVVLKKKALGPDHPEVATSLVRSALVRSMGGDYLGARPLFERALSIRERWLGAEHLELAEVLGGLATVYWNIADYASAKPLFERALAIRRKNLGPDSLPVAQSLSDLGILLWKTKDYAAARPLLQRALAIRKQKLEPDSPWVAASLNNLGIVLKETGDLTGARKAYEEAMAIREKALGPEHPRVATGLNNLGNLLEAMGDWSGAEQLHARALTIRRKSYGPDHPEVAQSLTGLAETLGVEGDFAAALESALEAEAIRRRQVRLTARGLAEREALLYESSDDSSFHLAVTLAAQPAGSANPALVGRVWDMVIRSRALVFDEMAGRARAIPEAADPEISQLARDLAAARARLARLMIDGPERPAREPYHTVLAAATREEERAERSLAERSISVRDELAGRQIGFQDVAAALPAGSALVAFSRYSRYNLSAKTPGAGSRSASADSYLAFVVRGGHTTPVVVPLGMAGQVEAAIGAWRSQMRNEALTPGRASAVEVYRNAGQALRRKIWDPLAPALQGAARVFLVPDGAIHLVSFAALPTGSSGYLLETGPLLHYLSAERDLVPSVPAAGGRGLLALGDPDFDWTGSPSNRKRKSVAAPSADTACGAPAPLHFDRLRGTLDELSLVEAIWRRKEAGPVSQLTGSSATKLALEESAPGKKVLHLATHGFFLDRHCPAAAPGTENPLPRAGLALTGANRRDARKPDADDGVLTAAEVASLNLHGVEWAVLSACETGLGEVKAGEGVLGMQRAFRVAGAATVIMSLWSVEDKAVRDWMAALYRARLLDRRPTAQAVRDAGLNALRHRRDTRQSTHPFYWAAFVATGDWR